MKLRFSRRSVRDIASIGDYLSEHNPAAARRVRAAILKSLRILTLFPQAGRRQRVEGVRKHVTRPYSYVVYYTIDALAEEIHILTIQHPAQDRDHDDQ